MKILSVIFFLFTINSFSQENANLLLQKAITQYEKQEYIKAIKFCDEALAIDTILSDAYIYRAVCKSITNDIKGGLADLNKVISFDSKNAKAYRNRAIL